MRNLLALVGGAVVIFAGVGWYLDWYKIKSDPAPAGHQNVNIDFNRVKIAEDVNKGIQKSEQKLQNVLDKEHVDSTGKPAPSPTPLPDLSNQ
jgi:hypothetical protein